MPNKSESKKSRRHANPSASVIAKRIYYEKNRERILARLAARRAAKRAADGVAAGARRQYRQSEATKRKIKLNREWATVMRAMRKCMLNIRRGKYTLRSPGSERKPPPQVAKVQKHDPYSRLSPYEQRFGPTTAKAP